MRDGRRHVRGLGGRARRAAGIASLLICGTASTVAAQVDTLSFAAARVLVAARRGGAVERPFAAGERLRYGVRIGSVGAAGTGEMTVSGPLSFRGVEVLVLKSVMRAGVGPISGSGRTESWLDADRMTALRFVKNERRMLSRYRESVDVFPETRRWTAADGTEGATPSGAPLDELSFIYFIRTLPLTADTTFEVSRHFDASRNPVGLRIEGHEMITTGAGEFATVVVTMRVKDPRHYRGEGTIRLHLTDDACRLPVRIESTMPDVGKTVLTLESATRPDGRCSAPQR
jgi:hypothetical protein